MVAKPRLHHSFINPHASGIVKALQKSGHETYLVGGCVRDLLVGIIPKDFDIATHAKPNQIKKLIYNSYIIGKRFRLVLVKRDQLQLEVATFRRDIRDDDKEKDLPKGDNIFGSPQEDANRRDFTINGLFYDPINDKLIDYCNGLEDLESHTVRMIGDPDTRLTEDSIRILRAIRLAHKLNFSIEPKLRHHLEKHADSLQESALPRRREEFLKFLRLKDPSRAFIEAHDLGVLKVIAPNIHNAINNEYFIDELRNFHVRYIDKNSPLVLFSQFIHAYYRCLMQTPDDYIAHAHELLEDEKLSAIMRDELGMFRYEQSLTAKSIQIQTMLARRGQLEKKGQQRQLAIVHSESYPLAVNFAKVSLNIAPGDLIFWENLYELHHRDATSERAPKRRHRRQPKRSSNKKSQSTVPSGQKSISVGKS